MAQPQDAVPTRGHVNRCRLASTSSTQGVDKMRKQPYLTRKVAGDLFNPLAIR